MNLQILGAELKLDREISSPHSQTKFAKISMSSIAYKIIRVLIIQEKCILK